MRGGLHILGREITSAAEALEAKEDARGTDHSAFREPQCPRSLRRPRLGAFTIFESTVAVTIISVIIGIASLIYSNVIDSEKPVPYYQAKQEVDKIFQDTKSSSAFFSKNFSFETYEIKQDVEFYNGNKKLYQLDYTITTGGKQWWKESHLVANTQDVR